MKKLLSLVFLLSLGYFSYAQNYTISGYITDEKSGESLIGANVVDIRSGKGTVTNTYGFYSLTLPGDSVTIGYSYIGYSTKLMPMLLNEHKKMNISLSSDATLDEVEIIAEKSVKIEDKTQMSSIKIPVKQLKKIPALLGETDILKAIQLLPGVQSGGEGQSGFYVRGGSQDQNLILLDGTPVYNASHLFGFFSVFNSDAIKDVKLVKGGFPARYGGRLSSVLEINMKEGNNKSFHGSGTIGLVASKLTLEGPIVKDKASFIISGRRTYIDVLARPLIKYSLKQNGSDGYFGYYFYDFNAKLNWKISDKDRIYLSAYTGDDIFKTKIENKSNSNKEAVSVGLGWGNITSALRWNHLWTDQLFSNLTFTYSKYKFSTNNGVESQEFDNSKVVNQTNFNFGYSTGITDFAGKLDFDYIPSSNHFIRFGANVTHHLFDPSKTRLKAEIINSGVPLFKLDTVFGQKNIKALEYFMYVEDDYKVTERLNANIGVHFSGFSVKKRNFTSLQPRVALNYKLPQNVAIKASFSTMRQYIQFLTNENLGLPWDQWLPTTDKVVPQKSWQVAVGAAKTIAKDYEFSFEAYYKGMSNITSYKEGASLFQSKDWQEQVTQGKGRSYGLEFFVQKKTGKFSGWLGYTLSWSERKFDDKNFGKWYPYTFDRRHDISIVGIYEFSDRISLSGTWVYGTGNSYTLPTSRYIVNSTGYYPEEVNNVKERNNYRLAPYHRADINVDFKWGKRRVKHKLSIGAYNMYSRKNPFFVNPETKITNNEDGTVTKKRILKQYSLFPIIPSIAYSFEF